MIEQLFIVCGSMGLGSYLFNLIGASLYDISQTKQEKDFHLHPYARPYRRRPLVSVVISAENDARTITDCLQSLIRSSYRNIEIIIVDHASADNTRRIVRQFQAAEHPKCKVRLVARRSAADKDSAVATNIRRYAQGEYILRLGADCLVDKQTITRAARMLNTESGVDRLQLQQRTFANYTTVGLLQRYHETMRVSIHKCLAQYRLSRDTGLMPLMYRQQGNSGRTYYAHGAVIYQAPASYPELARQDYRQKLASLQATLSLVKRMSHRSLGALVLFLIIAAQLGLLLAPAFIGYFFYLAVHLHEPAFLLLSTATTGVLLVLAIWSDQGQNSLQKLAYTLFMPVTFLMFYVLSLTRLFVLIRTAWEI